MRAVKHAFALLLAGFAAGCSTGMTHVPSTALDRIREEDVRKNLFFLASDSLKGRNTPSPELDTAASFIAGAFAHSGLRPVDGSYFQTYTLNIVNLGDTNELGIRTSSGERSFSIKDDFTPFEMTANRQVRAPVVFAGYGITAPEYNYDDYAGIDVKGKIVFILRHEPGEEDSTSVFMGKQLTDHSNMRTKVRIAVEHGAVGMLVATDPLNHGLLTPRGFPWPSLSRIIPKDALPLTLGADEEKKIPVVHIGETVISQLLGSVDSLRALEQAIDASPAPHSFQISGAEAYIRTSTEITQYHAMNVVGLLPGTDPARSDETVIVGAHYDHVGEMKQHAPGERYIFKGADDNASGTCALMAVAAALGGLPSPPRRSVLCIAFSGEEKGLYGSEYYARHPLRPLNTTVAMLNMDMVGRNAEDTLYLIGSSSSPDIARIAREEDGLPGFVLVDQALTVGGSDHMSFMKRNIPDLYFHSGLEKEYHTVNDVPELINTRKIARVAELVALTACHIANDTVSYRYFPTTIPLF